MRAFALATVASLVTVAALAAQQPYQDFVRDYQSAEQQRVDGGDGERQRQAYATALRQFMAMPEEHERWLDCLPAAGFCAHQAGELELALRLYGRAEDAGVGGDFVVAGRLELLLVDGQVECALRDARQRVEDHPEAVRAFLDAARYLPGMPLLGEAGLRLRTGDREVGLWILRGTAAASGDAIDLGNLALALRSLGQVEEAEAIYRRALELRPEDELLWNDFGLCLKAAGRVPDAIEAFRESRKLERPAGSGPAVTNLAVLAAAGHPEALRDPLSALRERLRSRASGELARRLYLDVLLRRAVERPARRATEENPR